MAKNEVLTGPKMPTIKLKVACTFRFGMPVDVWDVGGFSVLVDHERKYIHFNDLARCFTPRCQLTKFLGNNTRMDRLSIMARTMNKLVESGERDNTLIYGCVHRLKEGKPVVSSKAAFVHQEVCRAAVHGFWDECSPGVRSERTVFTEGVVDLFLRLIETTDTALPPNLVPATQESPTWCLQQSRKGQEPESVILQHPQMRVPQIPTVIPAGDTTVVLQEAVLKLFDIVGTLMQATMRDLAKNVDKLKDASEQLDTITARTVTINEQSLQAASKLTAMHEDTKRLSQNVGSRRAPQQPQESHTPAPALPQIDACTGIGMKPAQESSSWNSFQPSGAKTVAVEQPVGATNQPEGVNS